MPRNGDDTQLLMENEEGAAATSAPTSPMGDAPSSSASAAANSASAAAANAASNLKKAASSATNDFQFLKIVARICLQLMRRFWAFSSATVVAIVLFYWLFGGFMAFFLVVLAFSGKNILRHFSFSQTGKTSTC